ncbi:MAG TPA: hypothetical protein DF610_16200 [Sphingobacterium sp.]|nr:hypothetical protein FM120_31385 [Sphingobacterium faecium PCAi_F2.5]HCU46176.1 hypothetical protein [Sphingobacterium sp.]
MKITLPSSDVIEAIKEAKKDCMAVKGFFLTYDVKFNELSIDVEPKEGYDFDPTDVFQLAWYVKEYV